ncbi:MAG: hypothetical protein AVDCRST_MAG66-3606, partial [uncultured Pseudonocardia sp.]
VERRDRTRHRDEGQGLQPDLVRRAVHEQRTADGVLRAGRRTGRGHRARRVLPPRSGGEPQGRRAEQAAAGAAPRGL